MTRSDGTPRLFEVSQCGRIQQEHRMISTQTESLSWETPEFVEVRMDAEIGAYQDDFDDRQDEEWH